jgi:DNA-binding SARP family transcriptional activator
MELPLVVSLIDESLAPEQSDDLPAALRRARQALDAARVSGQPESIAAALLAVARVRFRLGQYQAAHALAEEVLALAAPDAPCRADAWQILGNCAAESGSVAEAETCYWQAADLAREIGYHRAQVAALHGLAAGVYMVRGQFDLALAADEQARDIACRQAKPDWLIYPLTTIAMIGQLIGQGERARAALAEMDRLVPPDTIVRGYHLCINAALALDEEQLEAGRTFYTQARLIAEASGEPWLNISVRLGMSRFHRLLGDGPAARAWADDALTFALRVGYRHEQGKALIERARAFWLCGDPTAAETDLHAAIDLLTPLGAAFDLARAWLLLAALRFAHRAPSSELHAAWQEAVSRIISGGYAFLLEQERALAFPLLASLLSSDDPNVVAISRTLLGHLARVPPPPLHVQTLGRFEVRQGKRPMEMSVFRQRRAGELLALLLIAPRRTLSAEQIAEALYPERPPGSSRASFHHTTSALRRALEPDLPEKFPSRYLEVEEGQVTLHLPPGSWVDVEAFEAHCQRGEWEEALSLYGGEFLPEYRYADWTVAPRERLALLYQRALLEAARARLAAGRFGGALEACWRLLALEPWHEEAVLLGMRACVALNDLSGARRLYLALEKALREDLGTAPQKELQAFYRSLTPPAPPENPHG